ncbi:copper resistance protein CopC, partial [Falsiroseomonas oryzae]|uniref:copper resistance protein CopC n=1 Tax=Falsiroseomonas oryzae TaxID=2766473 RepID=UPI0022EA4E9E
MTWTRRRACALAALVLAAPRGAAAHARLTGTAPAEGETLATPPQEIVLRFNEPVQLTALRLFAQDESEWPLRRTRDLAPRPEHRAGIGRDLPP